MTEDYRPNTYSLSYWEQDTFFRGIDTIVLGSGIVGLNAAIRLKELRPKHRVVVLERGPLPIGASTRNAGVACFGSLSELMDDAAHRPVEEVLSLAEERYRGLLRLRDRLGDEVMDYRPYGGYELFLPSEAERYAACIDIMDSYNREFSSLTGRPDTYKVTDEAIKNFGFAGIEHLIFNQAEGQIHTGKMMQALLAKARSLDVQIYNGVEVTHWEEEEKTVSLFTAQGWKLQCRSMLVATNGFAARLLPELQVRPARNQVMITQPVPGLRFKACFHYDRGYYYFRQIDGRILLGGGRILDVEGETTDSFGTTPLIRDSLIDLLHHLILPGQRVEIDGWWSGIMGVGDQKHPIVKRYSDRIAVAVRLGGMGVAIGSLVGERGAELLTDT
ncbi:MAG: FAD-dependent oxidoreductase [Saprospiraceae bacterium]|nr:FAD-binding oxidoreductase [Lewinella sp.]